MNLLSGPQFDVIKKIKNTQWFPDIKYIFSCEKQYFTHTLICKISFYMYMYQ